MKSHILIIKCLSSQLLEQILNQLVEYKHLHKSRKLLLKLDEHMLKDIGINKQEADEEGNKPFWKGTNNDVRQGVSRRPCIQGSPTQKRLKRYLNKPTKSGGVSF